jgi:hypothetical protein
LKAITTAVCFHKNGKVALDIIRLNILVKNGINTSEQHLIINDGIPSSPTHLGGKRRLKVPLTLAAEIGTMRKMSETILSEGVTGG